MIEVRASGDFDAVIKHLYNVAETADKGVRVGVMGVSEEKAMHSEVLEHRWHSEGPSAPSHWETGQEYVSWAYAARTAKTMQKQLEENMQEMIDSGIVGDEFWHQVGQTAVERMKGTMAGVQIPMNADSTIRQKGENNPLIDTGEMKSSVSYKIKSSDEMEEIESIDDSVPPAF